MGRAAEDDDEEAEQPVGGGQRPKRDGLMALASAGGGLVNWPACIAF